MIQRLRFSRTQVNHVNSRKAELLMNTAFGRKFSPYDIHDAVGEKDFCTRQAVVEWPEFMMHDAVSLANWPTLLALFPEFQLTVQLGTEVIASLNSIPLAAPPVSQLDDGGWDWALETGISGKRVERPANCLCGLQIGICREMQGKRARRNDDCTDEGACAEAWLLQIDHSRPASRQSSFPSDFHGRILPAKALGWPAG